MTLAAVRAKIETLSGKLDGDHAKTRTYFRGSAPSLLPDWFSRHYTKMKEKVSLYFNKSLSHEVQKDNYFSSAIDKLLSKTVGATFALIQDASVLPHKVNVPYSIPNSTPEDDLPRGINAWPILYQESAQGYKSPGHFHASMVSLVIQEQEFLMKQGSPFIWLPTSNSPRQSPARKLQDGYILQRVEPRVFVVLLMQTNDQGALINVARMLTTLVKHLRFLSPAL